MLPFYQIMLSATFIKVNAFGRKIQFVINNCPSKNENYKRNGPNFCWKIYEPYYQNQWPKKVLSLSQLCKHNSLDHSRTISSCFCKDWCSKEKRNPKNFNHSW